MTMYVGVGVMSGTSLDALDICCVEFIGDEDTDNWKYTVIGSKTVPYSDTWRKRLQSAPLCNGEDLMKLNIEYGHFVGEQLRKYMDENPEIDDIKFIAPHGHTVFHQPHNKFTFQLGDGETMASHVTVPLVTNFRTKDVALGGQGAPLENVGERHLYAECNMFLNLGGICNLSVSGKAFDTVPCNMLLNHLSEQLKPPKQFDDEGKVAASGKVIKELLKQLNKLDYYTQPAPKSLGREWFEKEIRLLFDQYKSRPVADLLRTAVEHITDMICKAITHNMADTSSEPVRLENTLLITGGGALNKHLVSILQSKISHLPIPITILDPEPETVKFKEAIICAFLGLRTLLGLKNTLCQATGAVRDTVSGSIHLPPEGNALLPHLNKACPFHIMRKISRASVNTFGSTEELGLPGLSGMSSTGGTLYESCGPHMGLRDRTLTH